VLAADIRRRAHAARSYANTAARLECGQANSHSGRVAGAYRAATNGQQTSHTEDAQR
jgi:hypothetical protein